MIDLTYRVAAEECGCVAYPSKSKQATTQTGKNPIEVRLFEREEDLKELERDWDALEMRGRSPLFFQSRAWCRHILASGEVHRPLVATAWRGERLVALWPLAVRQEAGARLLTGLGAPYDQYSEIIVDHETDASSVVAALALALASAGVADGLLLRKVRLDGAAYRLAESGAHVIDGGERAPQITLDPSRPFSDFLAGISAKTRKNLRNYRNRLAKLGRLEHHVRKGPDAGPVIIQGFEGRRAWLLAHGMSSEAFRDPNFESIVLSMARTGAADLGLVAFVLTLDDKPIALQWGFIRGNHYYAFMSSRDPAFEDYSAGRLHLQYVIEACHELGICQVDLMVPAVPYKMTWTDSADALVDLAMPWSMRGWLVLDLYQRRVRPLLKHIAKRLPETIRRPIFAMMNASRD